jgi:hypothetical protein
MEPRRSDPSLFFVGLLCTAALHAGVLAVMLWSRASATEKPILVGTFVDAQLVRFGKPRDLRFLPHKQGVIKDNVKPDAIKVAKDEKALPRPPDEKKPDEKFDPLKKTHAEQFKNLADQPEGFQEAQEGSLTGSRAGTATEASGDPYIQSLMRDIGEAWTVPTTIRPDELKKLNARICINIADDGTVRGYEFRTKSGNSQFDSSLDAALSKIKKLAPPTPKYKGQLLCAIYDAASLKQ